jgi:hypothetical protein
MTRLQNVQTVVVDGISVRCCLDGPAAAPVVMFGNGLATTNRRCGSNAVLGRFLDAHATCRQRQTDPLCD